MAIPVTCPRCARSLKKPGRCPRCTPAAATVVLPKTEPIVHLPVVLGAAGLSLLFVAGLVAVSVLLVARTSDSPAPRPVAAASPTEAEFPPLPEVEPLHMSPTTSLDLLAFTRGPASETAMPEEAQRPAMVVPQRPVPVALAPAVPALAWRRTKRTDEELRKDLLRAPELKIDDERVARSSAYILSWASRTDLASTLTTNVIEARADLVGLPLKKGADSQLGKEPAENLQGFSRKMRTALSAAQAAPDPAAAAEIIRKAAVELTGTTKGDNAPRAHFQEAAIPTLMQMLCVENQPVRQVMIEYLEKVDHPVASEALAKMALFDLSDKIRAAAVQALEGRPRDEYRPMLLKGLRYPIPAVADHAAEALVALKDRNAVQEMKLMLDEPDPLAPVWNKSRGIYQAQEVVRVNHLSNCLMCHAPSTGTSDMVRGRLPTPGQPLPPLTQYYESNEGTFVRADLTFLKQDFSVVQPVENSGPWPKMQRFDYVVRTRPLPYMEGEASLRAFKRASTYPQRETILAAIKELTD